MQMNNQKDNMFSENTFTFQDYNNGKTNELIEKVYSYVVDRVEELKFGTRIIDEIPNFSQFLDSASGDYWTCSCKRENSISRTECWHCGAKRT